MPENKATEERRTTVSTRKANVILTVTRPVLTPEEYERRMNELKRATADFIRASYKEEKKAV